MDLDLLNMDSLEKYNKYSDYYTAGYEYYSSIDARFLNRTNTLIQPKTSLGLSPVNQQSISNTPTNQVFTPISPLSLGNMNPVGSSSSQVFTPISPLSLGNMNPVGAVIPQSVGNSSTTTSNNTTETSANSEGVVFPMGGGGGGGSMPEEQQSQDAPQGDASKLVKEPMSKNMKLGLGLLAVIGVYFIYKYKNKIFTK